MRLDKNNPWIWSFRIENWDTREIHAYNSGSNYPSFIKALVGISMFIANLISGHKEYR